MGEQYIGDEEAFDAGQRILLNRAERAMIYRGRQRYMPRRQRVFIAVVSWLIVAGAFEIVNVLIGS